MTKKFNAVSWADTLKGLIDNPEALEEAVSVGFVETITIEAPATVTATKGKKKGLAQIIEESEEPEPHDVGMGEIHIEY